MLYLGRRNDFKLRSFPYMEIKTKSEHHGNMVSLAETSNDQAQSTILDNVGEPIDPMWAATFRGFFWGEGSMYINRYDRKNHGPQYSYNVYCRIQLRDDDRLILEHY